MPCLSFNFILITRERERAPSKLFIEAKKAHHKQHFVEANNDEDDLSVREFFAEIKILPNSIILKNEALMKIFLPTLITNKRERQ